MHGYVVLSSALLDCMVEAPADVPDVHPNIANATRQNVERFTEALSDPDDGREAAEALRSLIGEIVLPPSDRKRDEVHAELRGELMSILAFATEKNARSIGIMSPAVSCGRSSKSAESVQPPKAMALRMLSE